MVHTHRHKLTSAVGLLLIILASLLGSLTPAFANPPTPVATPSAPPQEKLDQAVLGAEVLPQGTDSFVVTWKTRRPSRGAILLGESPDRMTTEVVDDRGGAPIKRHRAVVQGLRAGAVYYFVIMADDTRYDNGGTPFKVRTSVPKEQPDQNTVTAPTLDQPVQASPRADDINHPVGVVAEGTAGGFSVTWRTLKAKRGWIQYGLAPDQLSGRGEDVRGTEAVGQEHQVTVSNLLSDTVYYFNVVVDGVPYENGNTAFKIRVGQASAQDDGALQSQLPERLDPDSAAISSAILSEIGGTPFTYPTAGFMGEPFTATHNGLDIWTSDPNQLPCGNEVRAAFRGKVKNIWKSTTFDGQNWVAAPRGDPNAAIVVLEHTNPIPGLPTPFYTYYLHMAKDPGTTARAAGTATCIYPGTWDKLVTGEQLPAGFPLGQQGDLRLSGDRITHLHFSISTSASGITGAVNPAPYLGISSLQRGNALLYSGQAINLRLSSNTEQDTIYFNGDQGQLVTLRMNRLNTTLDGYMYLYAPNGTLVAQDDDSGGNLNPLINRATLPQTGTYRIVTKSFNSASSGGYSLSLNLESPMASCTPGANGVVLYEHANYTGRCVTLTGDQADFTTISFNDMASSLRFVGSYASGWEAVLYEHTYYGGLASAFRGGDPDLGNDTIGHDRASSVRIRQVDPDDGRVISNGQTLSGQINPATDQDTYYFDGSQGQLATLRMNRTTTTLDGYMSLYAPNGALVTQDDDSGGNLNPLINRATLPQTGRYRIVLTSYGSASSGGYSLSMTLESPTASCTPGANGVVLYEHANYAGRCVTLTGDQADFTTISFNDMASSLRFVGSYASGWEAVLYEHTYYGGLASAFRGGDPDLGNDTIGHDRASSVRIRQVVADVIVDEQSGAFTKGGSYWQDDWSRGYNNHMYWTCVNGNVVDSWGEWRPSLPTARSYELFAFIPDYHTNTANARYEVHHAGGITTVARSQQSYSNAWVSLGTFSFNSGTAGYVRLTDATGEAASCTRQIGFDAIKWTPR